MSETSEKERASELAQKLEEEPSRLTDSLEGEGTIHQPIIEYLDENEEIQHIFTANMKSIAIGDKDSGENLTDDGKPTYIFTGERILGIMPKEGDDETYEIPYDSIVNVENNFGWTKFRMAIQTDGSKEYHLWISGDHSKENLNAAKDYILDNPENDKQDSEEDNVSESSTSQKSKPVSNRDENSEPEYSFTAKKKGIKIEEDGETKHLTSDKGSKSKFEFTDNQFIATILPSPRSASRFVCRPSRSACTGQSGSPQSRRVGQDLLYRRSDQSTPARFPASSS